MRVIKLDGTNDEHKGAWVFMYGAWNFSDPRTGQPLVACGHGNRLSNVLAVNKFFKDTGERIEESDRRGWKLRDGTHTKYLEKEPYDMLVNAVHAFFDAYVGASDADIAQTTLELLTKAEEIKAEDLEKLIEGKDAPTQE